MNAEAPRPSPARPQRLILIAAMDEARGIGKDNALLWHLPEDLAHFKQTTQGHPILMGRKTWDSIGRPLPGRRNIVITRNPIWEHPGAERAASLDEALALSQGCEKAFVIGGGTLYAQALHLADELILTRVQGQFEADTWFPEWLHLPFACQSRVSPPSRTGLGFTLEKWQRAQGV
jgi:dihydrofolate reductase